MQETAVWSKVFNIPRGSIPLSTKYIIVCTQWFISTKALWASHRCINRLLGVSLTHFQAQKLNRTDWAVALELCGFQNKAPTVCLTPNPRGEKQINGTARYSKYCTLISYFIVFSKIHAVLTDGAPYWTLWVYAPIASVHWSTESVHCPIPRGPLGLRQQAPSDILHPLWRAKERQSLLVRRCYLCLHQSINQTFISDSRSR